MATISLKDLILAVKEKNLSKDSLEDYMDKIDLEIEKQRSLGYNL